MKDDSSSYAVFTEQGSSANQMTAAKVMDVIARLPNCAGQAADAVSAGSYAVLTEQGSSASQMTAAEAMDVIARLPDCAG